MKAMQKIMMIGAFLLSVCSLSACHTIHGAGQDIQQGGKAISNAAS